MNIMQMWDFILDVATQSGIAGIVYDKAPNIVDDMITLDGWVTVSLDGEEWVVETSKHYPATREEPEDVDVSEVFRSKSKFQIVEKVLDLILKNRINCVLQNIGEAEAFLESEKMYADWAKESHA